MPIPFNPERRSTCQKTILTLLYSTIFLVICRYCYGPLIPLYLVILFTCTWSDWRAYYRLKPLQNCIYYPPQWWQIDDGQSAHFMSDSVSIPYINQYCIVLVITAPHHPTPRYIPIWFDSMACLTFHDCIRSSKAYTTLEDHTYEPNRLITNYLIALQKNLY